MFRRDKFKNLLKKAHKHLQKGEIINAKNVYLEALAIDSNNIQILNNLAQIYLMLGDYDTAKGYNEILLKECNRLLNNEKYEDVLLFKSNALNSLNRHDEMKAVLDEILKINPENIIALLTKSHYLEKNKEHQEAINCLDTMLNNNPHDIIALLSKGRNLAELDKYDEAESCYNHVLLIEPKNKAAINLKSELYKKKDGLTLTSHDLMLKAIEKLEMDDLKSSEDYFKKANNMNPNFDEIWFVQGELYIKMGRLDDAINSFKNAFKLNPHSGGIEKKEKFLKMLNRARKIKKFLRFGK